LFTTPMMARRIAAMRCTNLRLTQHAPSRDMVVESNHRIANSLQIVAR
jgi:two-component sensor histidine kinase